MSLVESPPWTPKNLLDLPPEIILKIVNGTSGKMSVRDIVNIAQTCSSFRNLFLENKSIILNTHNVYTLNLPRGPALTAMSSQDLYARAARYITISARLSSARAPWQCRKEVVHDIGKLSTEPNTGWPFSHLFVHENILAFLLGGSFLILRLDDSGDIQDHVEINLTPQSASASLVDYQLTNDNTSLWIACAWDGLGYHAPIHVYEVSIEQVTFGGTTRHFQLDNVGNHYFMITMRDPYLALVVMEEILLVDWRRRTAVRIELPSSDPEEYWELRDYLDEISTVLFHPT
ncbi:hypothetical protein SISNIDRAFT_455473, partial [Sistotremastrum niveocremeum HHB9708]